MSVSLASPFTHRPMLCTMVSNWRVVQAWCYIGVASLVASLNRQHRAIDHIFYYARQPADRSGAAWT